MRKMTRTEKRDAEIMQAEAFIDAIPPDDPLFAARMTQALAHATLASVYQSQIVSEGSCHCSDGMRYHAANCPEFPSEVMEQ